MNVIEDMYHKRFVPIGRISFGELLEIIENEEDACWIIIQVTLANKRRGDGFYFDLYLLKSNLKLEELRPIIEDPIMMEDIVYINCHEDLQRPNLTSSLMGGMEIIAI